MIPQFNAAQKRRGVLPSSIARREADLRKFAKWLEPGVLVDAEPADIEAFIEARGWAPRTTYAFISHLSAFFTWARRQGLVVSDPTELVDRPKLRQGLPRPISDDDLAFLFSQSSARMHSWLALGALGGLRCSEIAGLHRDDVSETQGWMRVMGKGQKERIVPLHPTVAESLHRHGLPRRGPLFTTHGIQLTGSQVSCSGNRWMKAMGVDATMHQLRHWFGTRTYQDSQDLLAVAGLMGHANTSMTATYAAFAPKVARAAVLSLAVPGAART